MLAASQSIIKDVRELILDHIRQAPRHPEGDQPQPSESNLDGKIREIDEELYSLEEVVTSLKTRSIQRRKERNSLIRFNRLPTEIASNILWLSIADPWQQDFSRSFLQRLRIISSVCSSWRTLVEGSPRFWSIIEFSSPESVILDLLRKSGSSPLEIKCFSDGDYDCTAPWGFADDNMGGRYRLISPHTDRIRSLILSASTMHGLASILKNPAPILEELRLDIEDNFGVGEPLDLFCGQAGRLRDVVLWNIPFRWDSAVLAGLSSLKIKTRFDYPPSEVQVRRLLEGNPGLETMDIEDGTVTVQGRSADDAVGSSDGGKPSRVAMSKMQKLRLCSLPFELFRAVLDNVEIPFIQHFHLRYFFPGQPASRLWGLNMKRLVAPLLLRSQGTRRAEITFGNSSIGFEIYLRRQDPTIRIELQKTAPMNGFEWLVENFFLAEDLPSVCAADIFQVSLKFWSNFDMAGGAFIPILDRLGAVKVKALTIESSCQHGEELIDYLGEPSEDSQWPLPHLTSLTIGGRAELANHLLSALRSRKDATPEGALNPSRPSLLDVLDLGSLEVSDRNTDEVLAACISSSGTFTRPSWRPPPYPPYQTVFGGDWDDSDDGDDDDDDDEE